MNTEYGKSEVVNGKILIKLRGGRTSKIHKSKKVYSRKSKHPKKS
jgi:hypothetical protein